MRQSASPERPTQSPVTLPDRLSTDSPHAGEIQPPSSASAPDAQSPGRATFLASFDYAWQGIVYVVRTQRNARVHMAIGSIALVLAAVLRLAPMEWAILLLCIVAVIVAEMVNTIVEATIDLITDRYHPLAKIAKDVAAGAVLVAAIGSAGIGLLVLGPHLWHVLFG